MYKYIQKICAIACGIALFLGAISSMAGRAQAADFGYYLSAAATNVKGTFVQNAVCSVASWLSVAMEYCGTKPFSETETDAALPALPASSSSAPVAIVSSPIKTIPPLILPSPAHVSVPVPVSTPAPVPVPVNISSPVYNDVSENYLDARLDQLRQNILDSIGSSQNSGSIPVVAAPVYNIVSNQLGVADAIQNAGSAISAALGTGGTFAGNVTGNVTGTFGGYTPTQLIAAAAAAIAANNTFIGGDISATGLTLGSLTGLLQANNGVVSATTSIPIAYGGTGIGASPSFGQLLMGNGSGGYSLVSTSSLGISGGGGSGSGTVASVGLTLPNIFSVSGSPVTASGTLAATLASQGQNLFLASPNGSSGTPTFRSIVAGDIPTLNQNTTGTAGNVTGVVSVANGGTGTSTIPAAGQLPIGNASGGYAYISTSTLGLTTSNIPEGSNLYFTTSRASSTAIAVLGATTSLPNITTLSGLTSAGALAVVGNLTSGSIGSGFGNINIGSNTFTGNGSGLTNINNSNWSGTSLSVVNGGTGTSTAPALNQLLIGNGSGGYSYVSTSSLGFAAGGSGTVGSGTTGQVAFYNANGTAIVGTSTIFFNGGNVGIGSTTPGSLLAVGGNAYFGGNVTATGTLTVLGKTTLATASSTGLTVTATSTLTGVKITNLANAILAVDASGNVVATTTGGGGTGTVNSGLAGQAAFYNSNGTAVSGTSTLFFNNGNLGIGTTTSPYALTIDGPAGTIGPFYSQLLIYPPDTNDGASIGLSSTYNSTRQNWYFGAGSGASPNTNNFRIVDLSNSNNDVFDIVPSTDYVGIGTTSPGSLLTVAGTFNVTGQATLATASSTGLTVTATSTLTGVKITNLASTLLAVDANGNLIATTTPAGTNFFSNSAATTTLNTGSILAAGTGTFGVLNATSSATSTFNGPILVNGSIIPGADQTYSLGATSSAWKDLFVGPGSIYVNGQEVLHTDPSQNVNITANTNQSLILSTAGTGNIEFNPAGSGQILMQGNVLMSAGEHFTSSNAGPISFVGGVLADNLQLSGNTLQATNTNGNITLAASGTGGVYVTQGNFGIGTTTPGSLLTVAGNGYFGGNLTASGTLTVTATTTTKGLKLTNLANAILAVDASGNVIATTTSGGGGSGTVNSGTANQVAFYNSSGTAVSGTSTISLSNGNILINNTGNSTNSTISWGGQYGSPDLLMYDGGIGNSFGWGLESGVMNFFVPSTGVFSFNNGGALGAGSSVFSIDSQNNRSSLATNLAVNTTVNPSVPLDVYGTSVAAGTPGTENEFEIVRQTNTSISFPQVAAFQVGSYATNSAGDGYGPATRLDINLKAAGNFTLSGDTNVMTLLSTGNVGIGSTTPGSLLAVGGNAFFGGNVTATGTLAVTGQTTLATASSTGLTVTATSTLTGVKITNLANTFLAVDPSGNLIATTSAGGTNYFTNSAATTSLNTGSILAAGVGTFGTINATSTTGTSTFANSATFGGFISIGSSTSFASLGVKGTGGTNPFIIASSSNVQLLTVLQNGNVGIGSSTPGSLLAVGGNAYFGGNVTATGTLTVTATTTTGGLKLTNLANTVLAVDASGNVVATTTTGGGTNYFSNSGASTTLSTGSNLLAGIGTFGSVIATGTLTVSGQTTLATASSTGLTVTATSTLTGVKITNLANTFLALDTSGNLIATTTPVAGTNFFTNSAATTSLNTGSILTAGVGTFGTINGTSTTGTSTFSNSATFGGSVGIGTTTPGSLLTVAGNIYATGNITAAGSLITNTISGGGNTSLIINPAYGFTVKFDATNKFGVNGSGNTEVFNGDLYADNNLIVNATTTTTGLKLTNLASTFLAVDASGNVIATTTPSGGGGGSGTVNSGLAGQAAFYASNGTAVSGTSTLFFNNNNIGIGTSSPYAKLTLWGSDTSAGTALLALVNSASTTLLTVDDAGDLSVGQGALAYSASTGITSISALQTGNLNFETDAGVVSWMDLPLDASSTAGTPESYTAQLDGNPAITVFGTADGTGNLASGPLVGIGTTTPSALFTIQGPSSSSILFAVSTSTTATTSSFQIDQNGLVTINTPGATSTVNGNFNVFGNLHGTTVTSGDLVFANNFRFTEASSTASTTPGGLNGLYLKNGNGSTTLTIDENGNLTVTGDVCANGSQCYGESIAALSSGLNALASSTAQMGSESSTTVLSLLTSQSLTNLSLSQLSSALINTNQVVTQNSFDITTLFASTSALSASFDSLTASTSDEIGDLVASTTFMENLASTTGVALASSTSFMQTVMNGVVTAFQSSTQAITSAADWTFNSVTAGLGIFTRVQTQTAAVTNGIEMTDQVTGTIYCVQIKNGDFAKTAGTCGAVSTSTPAVPEPVLQPQNPVIQPTPVSTSTPSTTSTSTATTTPPVSTSTPPVVVTSPATSTPATSTSTPAGSDESSDSSGSSVSATSTAPITTTTPPAVVTPPPVMPVTPPDSSSDSDASTSSS